MPALAERDPDRNWVVRETGFDPLKQHHQETVFTSGNGYLCTRGALEEGYPGDRRATFIHGVFDAAPIVMTELANAPDWLPLTVELNGERLAFQKGSLESSRRALDLRTGLLTRTARWRSAGGQVATVTWERFVSLAEPHLLLLRCRILPEFSGKVRVRAGLNGAMDNEGLAHWQWMDQEERAGSVLLRSRTRQAGTEAAYAMAVRVESGREVGREYWDVENAPTIAVTLAAEPGEEIVIEKRVVVYTSRDLPPDEMVERAFAEVSAAPVWAEALAQHSVVMQEQWERSDVVIEGDDEAQLAIRFNLFQLFIAAPRHDERVNIGAKTLSGFGYRGHSFWDTEIFMLPLFIYTAPGIARNLLNYRYHNLPGAHRKAKANGYEGAQFPWESADSGDEVTPRFVPLASDPTRLVRIWPGDIEIHNSADIAYAAHHYWRATGDDAWMRERGVELVLDTAKFWASRAEWDAAEGRYEYRDVIGPDENHEHVDNNFYTNRMAQWNLQTALELLDWLGTEAPERAAALARELDLSTARLAHWREVIENIYLPVLPNGLIEQFEGYFGLEDVNLSALEPRRISVQQMYGIEGANRIQVIKQPDVLMLLYVLRQRYAKETLRVNYDYYTPRTDLTFGSSLGPSIQAILACEMGEVEEAYENFIRAARADLFDVRGNANDGIHAASAAGTWQAIVFGFAGLRPEGEGWTAHPCLPRHWRRLAFQVLIRGKPLRVDLSQGEEAG